MKFFLLLIFYVFPDQVLAQDSNTCICIRTVKSAIYPRNAQENKISGTVIVEWTVSEKGVWSDPVVVQSLGYGCDEEALKAVKAMIISWNSCIQKCKIRNETKGKMKQPFKFQHVEE